ncbi:hypothetical protein BDZ90DRAFT_193913 [Jaminaea rosea]|uniref:Uncharacterized protein n=1 Tax=Jaminaea rosea TaxID=1569628 RepID=A0A316UNI8_9BASI|nr:hypothetical protein BDZ90DRAFT_193913 [Jaminaea rosea]PWN26872.1 hypothetical protein BDZ90DRAFT_193913 [Jaminaea rosea]
MVLHPKGTAGPVVFAQRHIRGTIFAYHEQLIKERREEVIAAIPRLGDNNVMSRLSYNNWGGSSPRGYFQQIIRVIRTTNILEILGRLGLCQANWLDYLLTRPLDVNYWLTAYSSLDKRPKSAAHPFTSYPQAKVSSGAQYESDDSNPMEIFYYSICRTGFSRHSGLSRTREHSTAMVLRDEQGRSFTIELLDLPSQQFLIDAAERCPTLLYADDSPFFPIHDAFCYSKQTQLGAVIWRTPPCPLAHRLGPGLEGPDELRRILEKMRDLFSHLVVLREHGVSLDGQKMGERWHHSLAYDASHPTGHGPWILPFYLQPTHSPSCPGKLARLSHWEEKLPPVPKDAWPAGSTTVRDLPWSQISAYHDPRVPGPRAVILAWCHTSQLRRSGVRRA